MSGERDGDRGKRGNSTPPLERDDDRPRSARRRLLKGLLAGGSVAGTAKVVLPETWSRPLVDAALVPAHAQATGPVSVTLQGPIVVNGSAVFLDRPSSSTGLASIGESLLDALVPAAQAGIRPTVSALDGCCLRLVLEGENGELETVKSVTIDCNCLSSFQGSGSVEQLLGSGINADGFEVMASSVSLDEGEGQISDGENTADFVVTPGPCDPADGVELADDDFGCDTSPDASPDDVQTIEE